MPNLCVPLRINQMHLDTAVLTLAGSNVSRCSTITAPARSSHSRLGIGAS